VTEKLLRVAFAVSGLALLAYGAVLAWEFGTSRALNAVQGIAWFAGGPLVHDGIVAPAVGVTGVVLTRFVPPRWRMPVMVGLTLTAVLTLLAVPLLWRPFGVPTNPGLHDRDYGTGLTVALGVVWAGVLVAGLNSGRRRRTGPARPGRVVRSRRPGSRAGSRWRG
jgi:hypothetical protein